MKISLVTLTSSSILADCAPRTEVATPKGPITISMNVKIKHETVVKAGKDVEELPETRNDFF